MATVSSFRPYRYDSASAGPLGRLVAPPYDVIDAKERDALRSASPYNAVHLELPDPPYERTGERVVQWLQTGVLRHEKKPGVIAWTQHFTRPSGRRFERKTLLATIGLEPYSTRVVRPHERTHAGPKEDRLRLLHGARVQISPVYGLYPDAAGEVWASARVTGPPEAELTSGDGVSHRLWWIDDPSVCAAVAAAMASRWILIADGHHRYETALKYQAERRSAGAGQGPWDSVMMGLTALEDPGLVVLPTHRLLSTWPEGAESGFRTQRVADLATALDALERAPVPTPTFGLIRRDGLRLVSTEPSTSASPAARLDVALLEERLLRPRFGDDQAGLTAKGILSYTKDAAEAAQMVASGQVAAAVLIREMPTASLLAVAEASETMPQKSTYFFPKLLTGVAFYPLGA